MKNKIIPVICCLCISLSGTAQWNWNRVKKQAEDTYNDYSGNSKNKLSEHEVVSGLKEALTIGSKNSANKASVRNAYWSNPKLKIPFPPEAVKVKNTAENLGMHDQVRKFEYTMNRAAEEAAKEAAPIFKNAITSMTIADGFKILKGADNAATEYLKQKTTAQLSDKFNPVVKRATEKVSLTKYWSPVINTYNKIPGVEKKNPDLNAYITERAIRGLFILVAEEELKIRKNPIDRVTDLLKKVFGSVD